VADKSIRLQLVATATGLKVLDEAGKQVSKISLASKTASQSIAAFSTSLAGLTSVLGTLAGGAVSFYTLQKAVTGFIADADKVRDLSRRIGETTEFLSEMGHVAELAGTGNEAFISSIEKLKRGLGDAARGTGEAKKALEELGLYQDVVNGKYRTAEEILPVISDRLLSVGDSAKQASLAADLFGRGFGPMMNMLKLGSQEMENQREQARRLGATITLEMADKADVAADAMENLKAAIRGFRNVMVAELVPYLTAGMNSIIEKFVELRETGKLDEWADRIGTAFTYAAKTAGFFAETLEKVATFHDQFWSMMPEALGGGKSRISMLEDELGKYEDLVSEQERLVQRRKYLEGLRAENLQGPAWQREYEENARAIEANRRRMEIVKAGIEQLEKGLPKFEMPKAPEKPVISGDLWIPGPMASPVEEKAAQAKETVSALRPIEEEWLELKQEYAAEAYKTEQDLQLKIIGLSQGEYTQKQAALQQWFEETKGLYDAIGADTSTLYEYMGLMSRQYAEEERERQLQSKMNTEEWLAWHLEKMQEHGSTLREISRETWEWQKKFTDDAFLGMSIGAQEFADDLGTQTERWAEITRSAAQSMTNGISSFFDSLITDIDNAGEAFTSMVTGMLQDMARLVMQKAVIEPLVGSLLGSIFGGALAHQGGYVGHDGVVPTYHAGGAVRRTGLALLEQGEIVLPRRFHSGGSLDFLQDRPGSLASLPKGPGAAFSIAGSAASVSGVSGSLDWWDLPAVPENVKALFELFGYSVSNRQMGIPYYWYEGTGGGARAEAEFAKTLFGPEADASLIKSLEQVFSGGFAAQYEAIKAAIARGEMSATKGAIPVTAAGLAQAGSGLSLLYAFKEFAPGSPHLKREPWAVEITDEDLEQAAKDYAKWIEAYMLASLGFGEVQHAGGEIERMHRGASPVLKSLASDEVPAILQTGEVVLSRRMVRDNKAIVEAILKGAKYFHAGGSVGGSEGGRVSVSPKFNVSINVQQNARFPVSVRAGPTIVDESGMIVNLLIEELTNNPNVRAALGGMFG